MICAIAEHSTTRLLLACPDRPGLIARVSGFLADAGLNIVDADQHSTAEGRFFMRMVFDPVAGGEREELRAALRGGGRRPVRDGAPLRRVEPGASGWRSWSRAKTTASPTCSGAGATASSAASWSRSSPTTPTTPSRSPRSASPSTTSRSSPAPREEAERQALELLGDVDLLVLARYMQVLSEGFLERARGAGDQHPPQLPAGLRRRRPLPPRARARGQADRRHRPLRHRRARRRPDHRPGRDPGQPQRRGRRPGPDRPRRRAPGPGPRGDGPPRRPRPARRRAHDRLLSRRETGWLASYALRSAAMEQATLPHPPPRPDGLPPGPRAPASSRRCATRATRSASSPATSAATATSSRSASPTSARIVYVAQPGPGQSASSPAPRPSSTPARRTRPCSSRRSARTRC